VPPQGSVGSGTVQLVGVIFFTHNSAAMDARDQAVLGEIARLHQTYGGIVRVVGHASPSTGTQAENQGEMANLTISLDRATAVAQVLLASGVPATAIVAEARATGQPVNPAYLPTGEAGNRRAEIFLEY